MANDIIYRRINGRIIPIKRKAQTPLGGSSGAIKAAIVTAIGGGVAIAAGVKAHSFQVASAHAENIFRSAKTASRAIKFSKKSARLYAGRNYALLGGAALAAAPIAYGISRFKKKKGIDKESLAAGFSIGGLLAGTEYYRRLIDPRLSHIGAAVKAGYEMAKKRSALKFIIKRI